MRYRIQQLAFGEILDEAFRLLRNHFLPMIASFAVLYIPLQLATQNLTGSSLPAWGLRSALLVLAIMLLLPLAQLFVTSTILDAYLSRPLDPRSSWRRARDTYVPYVGTTFLMSLALAGCFLLLIVPFFYFAVCWALVGPVAVMENTFGGAAMKRSRTLVRGHYWRTAGVIGVAGIVGALVGGAVSAMFAMIPVLGPVLEGFVQSVTVAYTSCAAVVLYIDLRCRHENFDLQLLADEVAQQDSLRPSKRMPSNAPAA